ncbi:MAG: virulence factor [Alphaproteobacteria bacterium]|nr:virulence factor [Alphaproteobacteria bacterium]
MATLTVVYWRDIPAQVIAEEGRGRRRTQAKVVLDERFEKAIDRAAMRGDAKDTDSYLEEWRKGEPAACGADLDAEAKAKAAEIEAAWPTSRLTAVAMAGGWEKAEA